MELKDILKLQKKLSEVKINYISQYILFNEEECKILIDYIEVFKNKGYFHRGETSSGESTDLLERDKNDKMCHDIFLSKKFIINQDKKFTDTFQLIWSKIYHYIHYYIVHVGLANVGLAGISHKNWLKIKNKCEYPNLHFEAPKLRKYDAYQDAYNMPHFDKTINIGNNKRFIAGIVYLNTINEGGETVFPTIKEKIKAVQGKIVLFPSNFTHVHYSKTTKKQDRYNIIIHVSETTN